MNIRRSVVRNSATYRNVSYVSNNRSSGVRKSINQLVNNVK